MFKLLFIAGGGAIGTLLRYIVSGIDYKLSNGVFPVSTMVVNLTGSLIIGFLWGLFEKIDVSSTVRMFIFIGILGGFTTFSTFSLENFNLLRDGEFKIALVNILTTNILAIVFVFFGFFVSRWLLNIAG
jgi:fluoride exporter